MTWRPLTPGYLSGGESCSIDPCTCGLDAALTQPAGREGES